MGGRPGWTELGSHKSTNNKLTFSEPLAIGFKKLWILGIGKLTWTWNLELGILSSLFPNVSPGIPTHYHVHLKTDLCPYFVQFFPAKTPNDSNDLTFDLTIDAITQQHSTNSDPDSNSSLNFEF